MRCRRGFTDRSMLKPSLRGQCISETQCRDKYLSTASFENKPLSYGPGLVGCDGVLQPSDTVLDGSIRCRAVDRPLDRATLSRTCGLGGIGHPDVVTQDFLHVVNAFFVDGGNPRVEHRDGYYVSLGHECTTVNRGRHALEMT